MEALLPMTCLFFTFFFCVIQNCPHKFCLHFKTKLPPPVISLSILCSAQPHQLLQYPNASILLPLCILQLLCFHSTQQLTKDSLFYIKLTVTSPEKLRIRREYMSFLFCLFGDSQHLLLLTHIVFITLRNKQELSNGEVSRTHQPLCMYLLLNLERLLLSFFP